MADANQKTTRLNARCFRAFALVLMAAPGAAMAGAGANFSTCVNIANASSPMTVNVTVGGSGTHCMKKTGQNATISVPAGGKGLYCASVGYAEEKGSDSHGDLCATDTSKWPVRYSIANTQYSGSETVSMEADSNTNKARLLNIPATDKTVICNIASGSAPTLCNNTSATWNKGSQGPLAVIFTPY